MAALREGHSIFDTGIQGLKSKVPLNERGQDVSLEQYKTGGMANVESAEKEQKIVQRLNSIIDQIAETPSLEGTQIEQLTRKIVNEKSPKEILKESVALAKKDIQVLERINPDLAEEMYEALALAISDNENIAPWAEEILQTDKRN